VPRAACASALRAVDTARGARRAGRAGGLTGADLVAEASSRSTIRGGPAPTDIKSEHRRLAALRRAPFPLASTSVRFVGEGVGEW